MTGRARLVAGSGLSISSRASRFVVVGFTFGLSLGLTSCGGSGEQPVQVLELTPGLRAFSGARLIIGSGAAVIDDGVLVVRDGQIESVGDRDTIEIPGDAQREDVSGRAIIPGLINAHGHVNDVRGLQADPAFYTEAHVEDQLGLYARYGVTTVFSLGGGGPAGVAVRDRQNTDLDHARLYLSGPVITANNPEDAADRVNAVADMGVDIIKIRVDDNLGASSKMDPDVYAAVIDTAHDRGLGVAAHLYYLADAKALLQAGVDLVAHSVRDVGVDAELVSLLTDNNVCYCPTLMREVSTFVYESRPAWFDDPFFLKEADPAVVEELSSPSYQEPIRNSRTAAVYKQGLERAKMNLKAISDAGVGVAMGTDTGPPGRFQGFFEHRELELMVESGLTPLQTLVASTGEAARCLQVDDEVGTLEAGKWADLVILTANPLEDIRNTRTIESVWVAGNHVPGS